MEWHPYGTINEKNGRVDVKVDIKALAKYYNKTIK